MYKILITKKQIKEACYKNELLKIGYCELQNLLRYKCPFAYSSSSYGWACDYYKIGNHVISTGYSPIGAQLPYELIKKYEDKAKKILEDKVGAEIELENLIDEFTIELNVYFNK